MKNRIFKVMKWTGLNLSQFADSLQVSPALLSSVKSERTKPTLLLIENIKRMYPEIDVNWLITGKGEMLVGSVPGGLHILTDDDEAETTATARTSSSQQTNEESEPAEEMMPGKGQHAAEKQPSIPHTETTSIAADKEVLYVETSQPTERKEAITVSNDEPVKRAVRQVLLMYNDGTYDSFEK